MGAHSRQIARGRNSNSGRRRGSTHWETASEGTNGGDDNTDGLSESGSFVDTLSEKQQQQTQPVVDATDFDYGSGGNGDGFARGTLIRVPSLLGGSGSGDGGGVDGRDGPRTAESRGQAQRYLQYKYHPDVDLSEVMGYAGKLSSSHEVTVALVLFN